MDYISLNCFMIKYQIYLMMKNNNIKRRKNISVYQDEEGNPIAS